ncbi:SRPBCC family protein [Prauserella oleivorans]|uniref:SRPBCC family protein n=1 Tax=Prauserella oleivorans TaxID=1478153 RepID=A0ABW5WDU6_9PSEU
MPSKTYSFEVTRTSTAKPETLFRLETDGARWSDWAKPLVLQSSWRDEGDPAPGGVGAIRQVGAWPLLLSEQTIVYEPPHRHVYTFTGPGAPANDYRGEVLFTPNDAGGTDLCWRGSFTEAVRGSGPVVRRLLLTAITFLSARLVHAAEREERGRG